MTLRPADLLECVRQMSDNQVIELCKLMSRPFVAEEMNKFHETNRTIAEASVEKKPAFLPPNKIASEVYSQATFDHFIPSNKECPNCTKLMMQCESHYRCWHCGNAEHDAEEIQSVTTHSVSSKICLTCGILMDYDVTNNRYKCARGHTEGVYQ